VVFGGVSVVLFGMFDFDIVHVILYLVPKNNKCERNPIP